MIYLKEFNTAEEYAAFVESGQMKRPNVSLVNEPFTTYYNKYTPLGVFIQHVDGTLYTEADWTRGSFAIDDANGVAVVAEEAQFVIAKDLVQQTSVRWTSSSLLVEGVFTSEDSKVAILDFNGQRNTEFLLPYGDTAPAASLCSNYMFPNGQNGYLPSLGELDLALGHKTEIDNLMTLIGGSSFNYYLWSSTQSDTSTAWALIVETGEPHNYSKREYNSIRAFAPLNL